MQLIFRLLSPQLSDDKYSSILLLTLLWRTFSKLWYHPLFLLLVPFRRIKHKILSSLSKPFTAMSLPTYCHLTLITGSHFCLCLPLFQVLTDTISHTWETMSQEVERLTPLYLLKFFPSMQILIKSLKITLMMICQWNFLVRFTFSLFPQVCMCLFILHLDCAGFRLGLCAVLTVCLSNKMLVRDDGSCALWW